MISAYFNCTDCLNELPEGESPADYARLSVGITPNGDLVVRCMRHDETIEFFDNKKIASQLLALAGAPCDCGHHHTKETMH